MADPSASPSGGSSSLPSSPPSPPGRRAGIAFILVTIWIDVLSWGVSIPVYPRFIISFTNGDMAQGAALTGAFMTLFALIQLFAGPVLGALSDAYGRRPVILLATAGLALDLAIMAMARNIWWLLVTRIVHAVTAATHSTAGAYIADVTRPEERARAYGFMGAAFGFGFIVGPAIGGALGQIDLRLPFALGSVLALLNVVYGYFVLPESLPRERRAPFRWRQANPVGALGFLRADPTVLALACVNFFIQLAHQIYPSLWVLYTGYRYHWEPGMVGAMLAVTGVLGVVVQSLLVGPVVKRIGERAALLLGLSCWSIAFAIEGWAPTAAIFLVGIPVAAMAGFAQPSLNALLSQRVPPDRQGQLQGANASIISLTGLIGPALYTGVFAWVVAHADVAPVPGASFYIAAAMLLIGALVAAQATRAPAPVAAE